MNTGKINKISRMAIGGYVALLVLAVVVAQRYVNPAPPKRIVIATGDGEGDYQLYATQYKEIIKKDSGVEVVIKRSAGTVQNLSMLNDPKSEVDVAFVQDGLDAATDDSPLVSLGSLYYEPLWVFYRGDKEVSRFSQLVGKRLAIGEQGSGTPALVTRLLKASGIDDKNTRFVFLSYAAASEALSKGEVDAAFYIATPDDELIRKLILETDLRLMSVDQAEAITRQMPFLHHLVLPHGAIDLARNLPDRDIDLISSTATLVARETLHPALVYLLLKAASEVHSEPALLERKGEFPIDKDYDFPISDQAKRFYKSGAPFWQRYLPFWIANLVDRFILVTVPLLALLLPLFRAVPKLLEWRAKSGIYRRYGELKYLETQLKAHPDEDLHVELLKKLDAIEDRVRHMKIPLEFSDHLYGLREHIEFVRAQINRRSHKS